MCLAHLFSFFIKVKKIIQGYDFSSEFSFDHIFIHFKVLCNYSFDFSLRFLFHVYVWLKTLSENMVHVVSTLRNSLDFSFCSNVWVIFANVQWMLAGK